VNTYVWRPYRYFRETNTMTPHQLDLSGSPADAEADFIWSSLYYHDTERSDTRHSLAAGMGHVWMCVVYQGPQMAVPGMDIPIASQELWAGQTSPTKADYQAYESIWSGNVFWKKTDGEPDDADAKIKPRTRAMFGDDGYDPQPEGDAKGNGYLSDGKPAVARHQWRLPPLAARAAMQYVSQRDYTSYGLDITSTQSTGGGSEVGPKGNRVQLSGGGCGSFVGLALDFTGIDEHKSWWVPRKVERGVRIHKPTLLWYVSHSLAQTVCQDADTNLHAQPRLSHWTGDNAKFVDPGIAGEWCKSEQAAKRPVTVKLVKDFLP
jgi:hypothetical protein